MLIDVQKQIVDTLTEEVKAFLERVFPDSHESAISALADQLRSGSRTVVSDKIGKKRAARWTDASRQAAAVRMKKLWAKRRRTKTAKPKAKKVSRKTKKVSKKTEKLAAVQTQAA